MRDRMARMEAVVRGRVQGVGFRFSVQREASALGLQGYVRNLREGGVEGVAEGEEERLRGLERHLRAGPPGAVVREIEVRFREERGGLGGFRVTF